MECKSPPRYYGPGASEFVATQNLPDSIILLQFRYTAKSTNRSRAHRDPAATASRRTVVPTSPNLPPPPASPPTASTSSSLLFSIAASLHLSTRTRNTRLTACARKYAPDSLVSLIRGSLVLTLAIVQTMRVRLHGIDYRVVSYYNTLDAHNGTLPRASEVPLYRDLEMDPDMWQNALWVTESKKGPPKTGPL